MRTQAQRTALMVAFIAIGSATFAAPVPKAALAGPPLPPVQKLRGIRVWPNRAAARIVIETAGSTTFVTGELHDPERIYFDLENTSPGGLKRTIEGSGPVQKVRIALTRRATTRVVIDLDGAVEFETSELTNPSRMVIQVRRAGTKKPETAEPVTVTEAVSTKQSGAQTEKRMASSAKVEIARSGTVQVASGRSALKFVPPPVKPLPKTPLIAPARIEAPKPSREEWLAHLAPPQGWTMPTVLPPVKTRKAAITATAAAARKSPKPTQRGTELAKVETPRGNEVALVDHQDSPLAEPARGADTLTRALGLKLRRVVLDAGHGGKDVGTISPHGLYEKDLVLDVTRRLGILIEDRLGSEVVYTRDDDTFIPLSERTVIANREKADLFLSIHANSSRTETVAGFETYYLNFTATKADMDVAARENAASERSISDLNDLVKQITMNEKLDESRQFAGHVHDATYPLTVKTVGKVRDRGVKKAPFMVLVGARMPSVLVEIGFMTNPTEEAQMKKPDYRQKIAEALFKGVSGYADTLSHYAVADAGSIALEAGN